MFNKKGPFKKKNHTIVSETVLSVLAAVMTINCCLCSDGFTTGSLTHLNQRQLDLNNELSFWGLSSSWHLIYVPAFGAASSTMLQV